MKTLDKGHPWSWSMGFGGIPTASSRHTPAAKLIGQLLEHHEGQVQGDADELHPSHYLRNQHPLELSETLQNVLTLPGL